MSRYLGTFPPSPTALGAHVTNWSCVSPRPRAHARAALHTTLCCCTPCWPRPARGPRQLVVDGQCKPSDENNGLLSRDSTLRLRHCQPQVPRENNRPVAFLFSRRRTETMAASRLFHVSAKQKRRAAAAVKRVFDHEAMRRRDTRRELSRLQCQRLHCQTTGAPPQKSPPLHLETQSLPDLCK
jgi:hypothetical protein